MFWHFGALLTIFIGFLVSPSVQFNLDFPRVLLPHNLGLPSNFTLRFSDAEVDDCFWWSSSAPHIVHVQPLYSKSNDLCSQSCIVTSLTRLSERHVTRITAFHKDVEISCDIITDAIHSIELSYTTNELFLEGPPESMILKAKNVKGHTFNSINGIIVHWDITGNLRNPKKSGSVISLEALRDSQYGLSDKVNCALENRGFLGSSIIVLPNAVGYAALTASLIHSALSDVKPVTVSLQVLPNIVVIPSKEIYLLLEHTVRPVLQAFQKGEVVDLNLEDFRVELGDANVATLNADKSVTAGMTPGSTLLSYVDINNESNKILVKLHVVGLDHIEIGISGGNFWKLEESKMYELFVELFDINNNKIYLSEYTSAAVNFHLPSKLFHVNSTYLNGMHQIIQTITPGSGTIKAELSYKTETKDFKKVTANQKVSVCQKIQITPVTLLLPFYEADGAMGSLYQIAFTTSGGTGNYIWGSSDPKKAFVGFPKEQNNTAVLDVYTQGDFKVTATDGNNFNIIATAQVSIQPVAEIEVYPSVVEASVGNEIIVPTAFLGFECKEKKIFRMFDNCSKVDVSVEIIEKHVITFEKDASVPAFGRGCTSLQFRCKLPGHSRVNLDYRNEFRTTFLLSCYKELKPIHPVRVAVLGLGTSKDVVFEGGPRKWPMLKEGHYSNLKASDPKIVVIKLIKDQVRYNKDLTVFRVTCKTLGETTLSFEIGNEVSPTNKFPAKLESSVKIVCSVPHSVHLKLSSKTDKKLQGDDNVVKVPFYGKRLFEVDIWAKDHIGRKFANISSFKFLWDLSDNSLAEPREFVTHVDGSAGYSKISRNFQEFEMRGGAGELNVNVIIAGYRLEVLDKEDILSHDNFKEVASSLNLRLVSLRDIHAASYSDNLVEDKYPENSCDS